MQHLRPSYQRPSGGLSSSSSARHPCTRPPGRALARHSCKSSFMNQAWAAHTRIKQRHGMSTASNSYFSLSLAPRPGRDLAPGRSGEQHSGRRQGCPRAGFPGCPGDAAAQAGPGAHGARCRAVTGAPTSGSPARRRRAAWVPEPPAAPQPEHSGFPGGARAAARPRPFPPGPAPRSRVGGKVGRARRRRRAPGRGSEPRR